MPGLHARNSMLGCMLGGHAMLGCHARMPCFPRIAEDLGAAGAGVPGPS